MDIFTRQDAASIKPAFFKIYVHADEMWEDFEENYLVGQRVPVRASSSVTDQQLEERGIDWRRYCLENIMFNW